MPSFSDGKLGNKILRVVSKTDVQYWNYVGKYTGIYWNLIRNFLWHPVFI